jgi:hypothetical protein
MHVCLYLCVAGRTTVGRCLERCVTKTPPTATSTGTGHHASSRLWRVLFGLRLVLLVVNLRPARAPHPLQQGTARSMHSFTPR